MSRSSGWQALPIAIVVASGLLANGAHAAAKAGAAPPAAPAAADQAPSAEDEAHRHFKVAISYLQDPEGERYEDAYGEFKRAYELSHSAKVLGNIGLCAMKLERDGEAINAYTRYLAEVPDIDADERAQIERDLASMRASAVHISVTVHEADTALSDTRTNAQGVKIHNTYTPPLGQSELVLRSGHHVLALESAGRELASWELSAEPGSKLSHDFVAAPPGPAPAAPAASNQGAPHATHSRAAPLIVTGIGAAALAAGGVFGVITLGKLHALEKKCPDNACPADSFGSDVGSVRRYVRTTDVLLISGGAIALTGISWYFLASPSEPQRGKRESTRFSALCTGKGCAGSLEVAF